MNKMVSALMLVMIVGSQFSLTAANITYYASEVKEASSSEVATESTTLTSEEQAEADAQLASETSETNESEAAASEVSESETEVSETEVSETEASESKTAVSEATTSEVSETTDSEMETVVSDSEATASEASEASESEDETDASEIEAKLTIDEDGAVTSKAKAQRASSGAEVDLDEEENSTTYVNTERVEAGSGESTIAITPTAKSAKSAGDLADEEVYYVLDQDGNLQSGSTKEPRSYDGNLLTVYNGTIVDADNAIARTTGGYEYSFYIYESVADAKSNTNGTPLSGGGFDATYIESVEEDGEYYYHVKISGYDGYVASQNMQIVPEELLQARTYYTVEDGDWVYYSAIDPLTSDAYDVMAIGSAPAEAEAGVKYYSDDDVNYYTDSLLQDTTTLSVSYNSYFQNLPFRSASNYSASDFKSYLKAKGKTNSEYYSETSAFTKAQSKESINALMMFSMANHESAYGTSTYAQACYNFFGRGAVDSDPDQACQYYSYPTATDGILAQSLFLENGYFDVLDWRYSGTHVGNKSSGMNVKYASDTDWGKKISNHAYMIDQYLGGKEEDKYAILKVSGVKHVYTGSGLSTKVKSSSDSGSYNFYDLSQMAGTSNTVNVVALYKTSDAYQILVPTAVKNSSSTTCSYTNSKKGTYPNYGGRTKVSVANNTANYSCSYGGIGNGKYWISRSNTSVINDKGVSYLNKNYYQYYDTGEVHNKFVVNSKTNEIKYAYGYDKKGNIIRKYVYFDGTVYGKGHGSKIKTRYYVNTSGNVYEARTYGTSQRLNYVYKYYDGATLSNTGKKIKTRFNIEPKTGYIIDAYGYINNTSKTRNKIYTYKSKTKYGDHGHRMQYRFEMYDGSSKIKRAFRYRTGSSSDGYDKIYTYQSGTTYGHTSTKTFDNVFWIKNKKNEIDYAIKYRNGNKYIKYTYDKGTIYGKGHGQHIKSKHYY